MNHKSIQSKCINKKAMSHNIKAIVSIIIALYICGAMLLKHINKIDYKYLLMLIAYIFWFFVIYRKYFVI